MTDWPAHLTTHAIERYQERVANLPDDQVREILSAPNIIKAIAFGAEKVKLGTGHRLVILSKRIVTVLPSAKIKRKNTKDRDPC